jgi:hypothetical protein
MTRRDELSSVNLAAYLEQEVTASEAASIEAALAEAPAATRRLGELDRLRRALRAPPSEVLGVDLVARVREGVRLPESRRGRSWWRGGLALVAALALAAGAFVLLPRPSDEFRAKGAGSASSDERRWAGVTAYRVDEQGVPSPLGATLPTHAGLVFSYTNLGSRPFGYLMIFGIDAKGEVRWFHPAFEAPGTDPTSIAILPGQARRALGELVVFELPPGRFTLHALFTRRPLHVLELEMLVAKRGQPGLDALPESSEEVWTTEVRP